MANTDRISTITSTEFAHNEVHDRATMSQKSSLPQVTRFVSRPLMPDSNIGKTVAVVACACTPPMF